MSGEAGEELDTPAARIMARRESRAAMPDRLKVAAPDDSSDEETSGGDSPPMQHPREGLPSPKLCLSITPKPAAAQGALGAACRTAAARG